MTGSPQRLALHLVSDLDGTWILDTPAAEAGLRRLEAFLDRQPGIVLTFATGRGLGSALALLAARVRRMPEHLVTDVGTALFHRSPGGRWSEDPSYRAWVDARWPKDLDARLARAGLPDGVRPQTGVVACRRLALEVAPGVALDAAAARLRALLDRLDLRVQVLASHHRLLDVLPLGLDKGSAVRHLGLPLPVVACGDSDNDRGLWRVADLPVLMTGHSLADERPGLVRPIAAGPDGILEVLLSLEAGAAAGRDLR
jgi:hydroxymethylpyrimidine pyrophosphatase-like HAD family hydrolase